MEFSRYYESRRNRRWLVMAAAMLIAGLTAFAVYEGVAASPKASAVPEIGGAATVEPIGKTGLNRVVFTPEAAKRLDIKTALVSNVLVNGERRTVIPYAAVLYDTNGDTWTYTSPKPLSFVRRDIRIDSVKSGQAVLFAGPRVGTAVVTVGAAEVWGVEHGGIGED
jgi:hypothetical protein